MSKTEIQRNLPCKATVPSAALQIAIRSQSTMSKLIVVFAPFFVVTKTIKYSKDDINEITNKTWFHREKMQKGGTLHKYVRETTNKNKQNSRKFRKKNTKTEEESINYLGNFNDVYNSDYSSSDDSCLAATTNEEHQKITPENMNVNLTIVMTRSACLIVTEDIAKSILDNCARQGG